MKASTTYICRVATMVLALQFHCLGLGSSLLRPLFIQLWMYPFSLSFSKPYERLSRARCGDVEPQLVLRLSNCLVVTDGHCDCPHQSTTGAAIERAQNWWYKGTPFFPPINEATVALSWHCRRFCAGEERMLTNQFPCWKMLLLFLNLEIFPWVNNSVWLISEWHFANYFHWLCGWRLYWEV